MSFCYLNDWNLKCKTRNCVKWKLENWSDTTMATDGAIRHTVLFKVGKKEDLPYVVEEIKKFEEDIKHHVSILSYFVSTHTGMIDHFLMQTFKINSYKKFFIFILLSTSIFQIMFFFKLEEQELPLVIQNSIYKSNYNVSWIVYVTMHHSLAIMVVLDVYLKVCMMVSHINNVWIFWILITMILK